MRSGHIVDGRDSPVAAAEVCGSCPSLTQLSLIGIKTMNLPLRCVVSVSGFRGIVGETIDVPTVVALAQAYGRSIAKGGLVVLGRDSRPTGAMFAQAAAAGLRAVGCDVVDIGIVPTPTVPIMIGRLKAAGGLQISASHNPVAWNAVKCFDRRGRNIDGQQLDRLLLAYERGVAQEPWQACGGQWDDDSATLVHLERVLGIVEVEAIRARRFTVLIDSVNGSGSVIAPQLLDQLGCRVLPLNTDPSRLFPRDPEPTAANVTETGAVAKALGADVAFVQDPDADRLAIIDDTGRYIGEEYTLVLCAAARLAAARAAGVKQPVACTNLSTSRMLDDVAAGLGARVVRSAVGEANVVDAMMAHKAVIGGEGNGGVIEPRVVWGRDSQAGMALVLELLARRGERLSAVVAGIPRYHIHKEKVAADREQVAACAEALVTAPWARGAAVDRQDGLKLSWADSWLHLRASGTEPASRIIAEAPDAKRARELAAACRKLLGAAVIEAH
jgi:phosphomannomutase